MLKKYRARYDLFPINDTKDNQIKLIQNIKPNRRVLYLSKDNHLNSTILSALMNLDGFPSMIKLNTYDLVEIYLGHSDKYESLSYIDSDILCLYHGYGELPNSQLNNLIKFMLNKPFKYIWFYLKGSDSEIEYLVKNEGFEVVNIDNILKPNVKSNSIELF